MEYLNRCLQRMERNHNFNHYAKCEKSSLTNLCFADDLFIFARGDIGSVELLMDAFGVFSRSTSLVVIQPNVAFTLEVLTKLQRTIFYNS